MFSDSRFRNAGIRVGRLFGIEIWLHWFLLIIVGIRLISLLLAHGIERDDGISPDVYGHPLGNWACAGGALLLSVLLHELGHCWFARRQGGTPDRVVLWPLGGLAECDAPNFPGTQFWVHAGGLLTSLALAVVAGTACAVVGWSLVPYGEADGAVFLSRLFVQSLFLVNTVLFVFNLVPCWPLDGGKILHTFLWSRTGTHSGALLLTLNISRIFAIFGLVVGGIGILLGFSSPLFMYEQPVLDYVGLFALLMGFMYFMESRARRLQLQYGEEETDGIFGYDFSSGYTSLERSVSDEREREEERPPSWLERRREAKRRRARDKERREDREVRRRLDELLEKIHRDGIASLTREEQRFLAKASRHVRESATSED